MTKERTMTLTMLVKSNGWKCDGEKYILKFIWIWLGKLVGRYMYGTCI